MQCILQRMQVRSTWQQKRYFHSSKKLEARLINLVSDPLWTCSLSSHKIDQFKDFKITDSASSVPGSGFITPPVCPMTPIISSAYGEASVGQLLSCWHQMSSCGQCTLFSTVIVRVICEWISGCCINLLNLLLTMSYQAEVFDFSLSPTGVKL